MRVWRACGGRLQVQDHGEILVVHVDQLHRVPGLASAASHDDSDHLTGEGNVIYSNRRVVRCLLVIGDRPGAGKAALLVSQIGAGQHRDHAWGRLGRIGVDRGDPGVRDRAADHPQVEHAGHRQVVREPAAAGDEALVLLA